MDRVESNHSGHPAARPLPGWGHSSGMLQLGGPVAASNAHALADRLLCMERIARYCWAYDERQRDALADCFTDEAIWEGNVLGETPIGPFKGCDRIAEWLTGFWPHQHDQRRHMLLNTIVESQSADSAVTLSYLLLMSSNGKEVGLETTGFYRVCYRRTESVWRIERLTAGFDAPFWPGDITKMSARGRARHGVGISES